MSKEGVLTMKVLVTGGRKFRKTEVVYGVLDHVHARVKITRLVHGDADGTDTLADTWADERRVDVEVYPADWDRHGPAAGPIRNSLMLKMSKPDLAVVFPGERGTNDMHAKARAAKVPVVLVDERGEFSCPEHLNL